MGSSGEEERQAPHSTVGDERENVLARNMA